MVRQRRNFDRKKKKNNKGGKPARNKMNLRKREKREKEKCILKVFWKIDNKVTILKKTQADDTQPTYRVVKDVAFIEGELEAQIGPKVLQL